MVSVLLGLVLGLQASGRGAPPQRANDTRSWYQAYADAQRDVQQQKWQAAIDDVQAAVRLGAPRPGRKVNFYGDVYRDFNPDYYLGTAYLNLKRFDEADKAFARVAQAQLIGPKDADNAAFTRQVSLAKVELLMAQAQQSLAQNRFDDAENIVKDAIKLGVDDKRAAALNSDIASSRQRYLAANAPAPGPPPGSSGGPIPAAGSGSTGGSVSPGEIATGATPPSTAPANPVGTDAGSSSTQNRSTLKQNTPPGIVQPVYSGPPNGRTTALPPRDRVGPTGIGDGSNVTGQRPPSRVPIATAERTATLERNGIVEFFSGQYQMAAAQLTPIAASQGASARAHFYLACSQVALVLAGKANAATLGDARRQLALAGDITNLTADKALVSPRIRQALGIP